MGGGGNGSRSDFIKSDLSDFKMQLLKSDCSGSIDNINILR